MVAMTRPVIVSSLAFVGTPVYGFSAVTRDVADLSPSHSSGFSPSRGERQTPEELGFSDDGLAEDGAGYGTSQFSEEYCLDIGAKGFPIPTLNMLRAANWDAPTYFAQLQGAGYAEDALQMTGPDAAILKSDCMKERFHGKTKHIFVGDSQMMALRNAFHRLNKCPEIWWANHTEKDVDDMMGTVRRNEAAKSTAIMRSKSRFRSRAEQAPDKLPRGCTEEGIASFINWDGWASHELPVKEIKMEMDLVGVSPADGDLVVVWIGSNFIPARHRMSTLLQSINKLHELQVKMVWDSPTFQDDALMAATTTYDAGKDQRNNQPIAYNYMKQRKKSGQIGSNEYPLPRRRSSIRASRFPPPSGGRSPTATAGSNATAFTPTCGPGTPFSTTCLAPWAARSGAGPPTAPGRSPSRPSFAPPAPRPTGWTTWCSRAGSTRCAPRTSSLSATRTPSTSGEAQRPHTEEQKKHRSISCLSSARMSWICAPGSPGVLRAPGAGVQRRPKKSAQSSDSFCLCRGFSFSIT
ncbi:unnamed protein product [Prorocentrum cordatum]|uniref:Uncharacterized protein n=1 Tax=Prorocentrum cordatum TaxID=2364126 RepID=A0ABN9Y7R1_9DINO|nr:unnamed protein product [Polarella glacialis]